MFAIQEKCVSLQVKIYTIMKKLLLIIIAFTIFYITQIPSAEGQTFYDYALGGDTFTPSGSVVRWVKDQKAIASYWDRTYYRLAYVEPMDVISAKIDDHHAITDIRIVGTTSSSAGWTEAIIGPFWVTPPSQASKA